MVAVHVSEEGVLFETLESHDPEVVSFFSEIPVESLGDLASRAMTPAAAQPAAPAKAAAKPRDAA